MMSSSLRKKYLAYTQKITSGNRCPINATPESLLNSFDLPKNMNSTDSKTYSLARKIFEGIALILGNIFTLGLINIFKVIRDEYHLVFCINSIKNTTKTDTETVLSNEQSFSTTSSTDESSETSESSKSLSEGSELPKTCIKESVLFPANSSTVAVNIPQEVAKSLDEIFGIKDVVSKMPVCEKIVGDDFSFETDLPHPIMKATDIHDAPHVFVKLKLADPEAYYEKCFAESDAKRAIELASEHKEYTVKEILTQIRVKKLNSIKEKTYALALGQKYYDGSSLLWGPPECYHEDRHPAFFNERSAFYIDQITYNTDGSVVESLKDKIPEFQKLFLEEGIGTDVYGNQWKLALD